MIKYMVDTLEVSLHAHDWEKRHLRLPGLSVRPAGAWVDWYRYQNPVSDFERTSWRAEIRKRHPRWTIS